MRLRSLTSISLLIVLSSLATVVAVPSLRRTAKCTVLPQFADVKYAREAEHHVDDPQAWLAVFSGAAQPWVSSDDTDRARKRLIELLPKSAAPYLLDGVEGVPLSRSEIDAYMGSKGNAKEEPLSAQQSERAVELLTGFNRAAKLDPDNAAIDYLRAYLALAGHRDDEAEAHLRSAIAKPEWNLYQRDAALAAYRIASPRLHPRIAQITFTAPAFGPQLKLLYLARLIVGMSVLAERGGDHARAIFLRESAIHLAHLMLANAATTLDGLDGLIAWSAVVGTPPSGPTAAPARHTTAHEPKGHNPAPRQGTTISNSCLPLVAYLRKHGRTDLANEVLSVSISADDMDSRIRDYIGARALNWWKDSSIWLLSAAEEGGHATGATLALLLAATLAALILRAFHRAMGPVRFSRFAWALALCLIFGLVVCVTFLFPPKYPGQMHPFSGDMYALLGLPLIMFVVLVVVIRQCRRLGGGPVGPVAQYVATLIAVLLPLAALFSLGMVGLTVAATRDSLRQSEVNRKLVEQGEVRYYNLGVR